MYAVLTRASDILWYIVYMTNIIVRDKPTANSVLDSSNWRVISAIISKVIVGKKVFVRWYEMILFSLMSTCSLESSKLRLNVVSITMNCERVLDPLNVSESGRRATLLIKLFGSITWKIIHFVTYWQTCLNNHPWDPQKVAVVHRWLLCRGFTIKIGIKISPARLNLAVSDMAAVQRWPF